MRTRQEAARAFQEVTDAARLFAPGAHLDGAVIEPMVTGWIEVLVGIKRDPDWGLFLYLGLGGALTESPHPRSLRAVPIDLAEAQEMVAEVFGRSWSAPALVDVLVAVSNLAQGHAAELGELDINPLVVAPDGSAALALDSLVYMAPSVAVPTA